MWKLLFKRIPRLLAKGVGGGVCQKRLNENEIDNYKINKDDGTINITYKDKNKELIDINLNINIRYFDEIEKEELIINNNSIDMKIKY